MSAQSAILLYNPISNEGHLDSWHVLFIEMFLAAGWNVIPANTDPQGLQAKLERKRLLNHPNLIWPTALEHDRQTIKVKATNLYQRVRRRFQRLYQSAKQREEQLLAARFLDPQYFKNDIERTLSRSPVRVHLIFNLFVDGYLPNSMIWNDLAFQQGSDQVVKEPIPWVGLCITPELEAQPRLQTQVQVSASPFKKVPAIEAEKRV